MAITVVQSNHAESAASGTTIGVTLAGVTAGNGIAGSVTVEDTASVSSVKDQTPTSAALDKLHDDTTGTQWLGAWSLPNSPAGSRTLTANFSVSAAFRGIQAAELSGVTTGPMLTGTPAANDSGAGTATAFDNTINTTPGVAGALVLQVGEGGSHQPTNAGAFTLLTQDTVNLVTTGYLVQGAASAVSPSFTLAAADTWSVVIVAYAPAATGFAPGDDRLPPGPRRILTLPRQPGGIETPPAGFTPRGMLQEPKIASVAPAPRSRVIPPSPSTLETPPTLFTPRGLMEELPPRVLRRLPPVGRQPTPDVAVPPTAVVSGTMADAVAPAAPRSLSRVRPPASPDDSVAVPMRFADSPIATRPMAVRTSVAPPRDESSRLPMGFADSAPAGRPIGSRMPAAAPHDDGGRLPMAFTDSPLGPPAPARSSSRPASPSSEGAPLPVVVTSVVGDGGYVLRRSLVGRVLTRIWGDDGWLQLIPSTLALAIDKAFGGPGQLTATTPIDTLQPTALPGASVLTSADTEPQRTLGVSSDAVTRNLETKE